MPTSVYFPALEHFPDPGHCAVLIQIHSKNWLPDIKNAPFVVFDVAVCFSCSVVLYTLHCNVTVAAACLRKRKMCLLPATEKSSSEEGDGFLCRENRHHLTILL